MKPTSPAKVIIPLPNRDFDPSETAVSHKILVERGHQVVFATPDGKRGFADPLMLSGEELDLWGFIPILKKIKLVGYSLRANRAARRAYKEMERDPAFLKPLGFQDLDPANFDGMVIPGGHWARGMRSYLEDETLQRFVGGFFDTGKPVGAICHGVVLLARSTAPSTGKSVLHGRKTTALTWQLENAAWTLMRFGGRFWDAGYYRTYPEEPGEPDGYRSVQAEVSRALAAPADFLDVPNDSPQYFRQTSGLFRDTATDSRPAWVVQDGNYVSGRWPGDVFTFAKTFADLL